MSEQWKVLSLFPNHAVSTLGRVRRLKNMGRYRAGTFLKAHPDSCGYYQVSFKYGGVVYTKLLHRLVAEAFITNPQDLPEVDHKNRDKSNNRTDNLKWITTKANKLRGQDTTMAKVTEADVINIHKLLAEGRPQASIAEVYGIDQSAVSNIKRGRNWAHMLPNGG